MPTVKCGSFLGDTQQEIRLITMSRYDIYLNLHIYQVTTAQVVETSVTVNNSPIQTVIQGPVVKAD